MPKSVFWKYDSQQMIQEDRQLNSMNDKIFKIWIIHRLQGRCLKDYFCHRFLNNISCQVCASLKKKKLGLSLVTISLFFSDCRHFCCKRYYLFIMECIFLHLRAINLITVHKTGYIF